VAWLAGAATAAWVAFENTKLFSADKVELIPVLDAFVATTLQVVAAVAVKLLPFIEQPVPVTVNRNAPVPEPPVVVRGTDVPVVFVKTEFEIVKVGWNVHDLNPCRGPKEKLLKLERIDKYPLLAAFSAVT
jgi:hypothetical protein